MIGSITRRREESVPHISNRPLHLLQYSKKNNKKKNKVSKFLLFFCILSFCYFPSFQSLFGEQMILRSLKRKRCGNAPHRNRSTRRFSTSLDNLSSKGKSRREEKQSRREEKSIEEKRRLLEEREENGQTKQREKEFMKPYSNRNFFLNIFFLE